MKSSHRGFTPLEKSTDRERSSLTGFTLSELMIASAILLVAILGMLTAHINTILLNESNNNLFIAANDGQYILEEIKGLPYDQISAYTAPQFANLVNETITLTRNIADDIAEVTVNVSWTEKQRQKNFQLSTRFAR